MLDNFLLASDNVLAVEHGFNKKRPKGLLYSQYRVLKCLENKETLKIVAAKRRISQQATGKALKVLVLKGFATKKTFPFGTQDVDRREMSISVTAKGKTALESADHVIKSIIIEVKDG